MLLRMMSACAPCIGFWINPTAYSGQDQDPSNETIVVLQFAGFLRFLTGKDLVSLHFRHELT